MKKLFIILALLPLLGFSQNANENKAKEVDVLKYIAADPVYPSRSTPGKTVFDIIKQDAEKDGRISQDGRIIFYYQIVTSENEFPEIYRKIPKGLSASDQNRWQELVDNSLPLSKPENDRIIQSFSKVFETLSSWYDFRLADAAHKANIVISKHKLSDPAGQYALAITGDLPPRDPLNVFKSHIRIRPETEKIPNGALYEILMHETLHAVAGLKHFKEDVLDKSSYKGFHIYPYTSMTNLNKDQEENLAQYQQEIGLLDMMVLEGLTGLKYRKKASTQPVMLNFKHGINTINASSTNDAVEFISDFTSPKKAIIKNGSAEGCQLETDINGKKNFIKAACINNGNIERTIVDVKEGKIVQVNMTRPGEVVSKNGNLRVMIQNPIEGGEYIFEDSGNGDVKTINPTTPGSRYTDNAQIDEKLNYGDVLFMPEVTEAKAQKAGDDIILNVVQQGRPIKIVLKNQMKGGIDTIAVIAKTVNGNVFRFIQQDLNNPEKIQRFILSDS